MLAPAAAKRMATMAGMTKFMGSASPATTVSTPEAIIAYPPKRCDLRHTSSLLRLQGVRRPKASFRSDFGMMLPQMTKAMPATRAAPLPTLRSSAANGEPLLESREHEQREHRHQGQEHDIGLQELVAVVRVASFRDERKPQAERERQRGKP